MKKLALVVCLLILSLVVVMITACGNDADDDGLIPIRLMLGAPERPSDQAAYDALMEAFAERGFRLIIETFEAEAGGLILVGLESHVIGSAAWNDFVPNARAGAYAPITREQVRTYMPVWYADNADFLEAATVDGVIYAIPAPNPGMNSPYLFLRTDWFPPGMTSIVTMEDLYAYLAHSLYLNPGIIPINLSAGQTGWQMAAKGFGATHLMAPGSPNATSPVAFDKRDYPNFVLMRTYEMETYVEFLRWMKRFYDSGFMTSDALHNPTAMHDSFFAGDSAIFTALGVGWTNWIYHDFNIHNPQPEAQIYVFDMGRADNVRVDYFSPMGHGLSIPAASVDHVPYVLQFIELLYTDRELHHLWRYGVEGVHYELVGEYVRSLMDDGTDMPVQFHIPYENHRFLRVRYGAEWPGFRDFENSLRERAMVNPFSQFTFDPTVSPRMEAVWSNLQDITGEFLTPILMGMVDDVDEALANITARHLEAGLEEFEEELLRQLNAFIQERGLHVTVR